MKEEWKVVKDYEGLYQVSNLGRVKSIVRWINCKNKVKRWQEEKILKPKINKRGYLSIELHKNGTIKNYLVHRLVAEAFISNPNNYPQVNHKDEDKTNNCASNLEFCTNKFNANYGTRNERISEAQKGRHHTEETKNKISEANSKPVLQINKTTNEVIAEFPSVSEVERQFGFANTHISACCKGKPHHNTAYGFKWQYKKGDC